MALCVVRVSHGLFYINPRSSPDVVAYPINFYGARIVVRETVIGWLAFPTPSTSNYANAT